MSSAAKLSLCVMSLVLALLPLADARASEVVTARVTLVEASYMPGVVSFQIDKPLPSCPLGTWFTWNKGAENNKAVYASLLAAMSAGKRINLYINSGDTSCSGQYLHILKD